MGVRASQWSYSTVRKYSKSYLQTLGNNPRDTLRKYGKLSTGPSTYGPWVRTYSKLFSCKSVLTVLVTEPSRMKTVRTDGCHVYLLWEFVGTACCTYGQSNTTNIYPTLGCDIQCFRSMGFRVQYCLRWSQNFSVIWLDVPLGANEAHLGIWTLPEFFLYEISCFGWNKVFPTENSSLEVSIVTNCPYAGKKQMNGKI